MTVRDPVLAPFVTPYHPFTVPWYNQPMPDTPDPGDPAQTPVDLDALSLPLLEAGCRQLGIPLSPQQLDQFKRYYHELLLWNQKFNLTSITDHDGVQTKHFLDSLAALPVLAEELEESLPPTRRYHLVDVGSGAGFPGVPLKIAAPRLKLTLMDGTGKKVRFLESLVQTLGLDTTRVVQGRAEELGRATAHRGQYDLVTARAVAPAEYARRVPAAAGAPRRARRGLQRSVRSRRVYRGAPGHRDAGRRHGPLCAG